MRVYLASAGACLLIGAIACSTPAPAAPDPGFRPTSTVKDIMDSIVDPSAGCRVGLGRGRRHAAKRH